MNEVLAAGPQLPRPGEPPARAAWRALGSAGVLADLYGPAGPTGAHGPDLPALRRLLAAADQHCGLGVTLTVCVQVATVIPALSEPRSGPMAVAVRDRMLAGEVVGALAVTDMASTGSDVPGLATTVRGEGDELVVDGGKRWITGVCLADELLVLARHRSGRHFSGFSWVLVPTGADGVAVRPADTGMFADSGVGDVSFTGVRVPRDRLVGGFGRGLAGFVRHVGTERLAGALWACCLARRTLLETYHLLTRRPTDGTTLWESEAVRQQYGRCLVEYRRMAGICEQALAGTDGALVTGLLVKAAVPAGLELVLTECARLQGADGFRTGGVQQLRAEAAMFGIAGGVTELMLTGLADHALDVLGPERDQ